MKNLVYFCLLLLTVSINFGDVLVLKPNFVPFVFEKNVFEKDQIGQFTNEQYVKCNSKLNGLFEIVSQHELHLHPSVKLSSSTKIECQVNEYLKLKGITKKFNFQTENFQLKKIIYAYQTDRLRTKLWFNEAISHEQLRKHLSMFLHVKHSKHKLSI